MDGCTLGRLDGQSDGCTLGGSDGECDGKVLGVDVGCDDGAVLGTNEGRSVGDMDGSSDGNTDGEKLGPNDGMLDGTNVGLDVNTTEVPWIVVPVESVRLPLDIVAGVPDDPLKISVSLGLPVTPPVLSTKNDIIPSRNGGNSLMLITVRMSDPVGPLACR